MPINVSDVRSNPQDHIAHAARVIGRSKHCRMVFSAIYQSKKRIITVSEIVNMTSLPRIRILQEGRKLYNNHVVKKTKMDKELAYKKDPFFTQNKNKILMLAGNKEALKRFPIKINPKVTEAKIVIFLPKKMAKAKQITIDEIDSFAKVKGATSNQTFLPIDERKFKEGLQRILEEQGNFQDWGGESDDLFSTRLLIDGDRKNVVFGLKGKGTSGILTPKKMGKRGDQIQRLFRDPADVFLVQYWGQIDGSIIDQMEYFAIAKSVLEGRNIYYGVIDSQDTLRILIAYMEFFQLSFGSLVTNLSVTQRKAF